MDSRIAASAETEWPILLQHENLQLAARFAQTSRIAENFVFNFRAKIKSLSVV